MKFTLDGVVYDVFVVDLTRTAKIADGRNKATALSGRKRRDVMGTYYSYTMTIVQNRSDPVQYDKLYEIITAPQNEPHTVVFPYGQKTLEFTAYIDTTKDKMTAQTAQETLWGSLAVTFEPEKPQRRP